MGADLPNPAAGIAGYLPSAGGVGIDATLFAPSGSGSGGGQRGSSLAQGVDHTTQFLPPALLQADSAPLPAPARLALLAQP